MPNRRLCPGLVDGMRPHPQRIAQQAWFVRFKYTALSRRCLRRCRRGCIGSARADRYPAQGGRQCSKRRTECVRSRARMLVLWPLRRAASETSKTRVEVVNPASRQHSHTPHHTVESRQTSTLAPRYLSALPRGIFELNALGVVSSELLGAGAGG